MYKVIIVCGSPGAGKSTYGKKVAKKSDAIFLDLDTVTERLVKVGLKLAKHNENDRDSSFFKSNFRTAIYGTLFDVALENINHRNVVIVGPFTKEIRNDYWLSELKAKFKTDVEVYYLYCSPKERRKRIIERANPRDRYKLDDWNKMQAYYGEEERPVFRHIFVDTSN